MRNDGETYYHGSSDRLLGKNGYKILPPSETGLIQEKGRKKNLDRVLLTKDPRSAQIYAGRSVQRFGGNPVVVRAIPMGNIKTINDQKGTTVYSADWVFYEPIGFREYLEYRGYHKAPNHENGAPLHDLSRIYPDDIYSTESARIYGSGEPYIGHVFYHKVMGPPKSRIFQTF